MSTRTIEESFGIKLAVVGAIGAVIAFIGFLLWWAFFVTTVENYEFAFVFDRKAGTIETVKKSGWIVRTPIRYSVHTIDLRPYQIQISADIQRSAASGMSGRGVGARVLNAKLVRFNPAGLNTFIEWHGRDAADKLGDMLEILKAYAFNQNGGKDCPFLTISEEITPRATTQTTSQVAR